jgi:hypothetical protein
MVKRILAATAVCFLVACGSPDESTTRDGETSVNGEGVVYGINPDGVPNLKDCFYSAIADADSRHQQDRNDPGVCADYFNAMTVETAKCLTELTGIDSVCNPQDAQGYLSKPEFMRTCESNISESRDPIGGTGPRCKEI